MGEAVGDGAALLLAFDIAALSTWLNVGLMPHARHGGKGVWALAVVGSKFEGTGFEKLQIVQTHVAIEATGGGGNGLPEPLGEFAPFLDGEAAFDTARLCKEVRFRGFGKRVTFGDDFRKPA